MATKILATSSDPQSLGNKMRSKRFKHFEELIKDLPRPINILDVGGTEKYWINRGYKDNPDLQIQLINLQTIPTNSSNIKSIVGDATNLAQFDTGAFDIVFSNSVIEHLYTYENQVKMAKECMRVGKKYYVQTPNKYFVIEPHYVFPLFQFFPDSLKSFILLKTKLSRGKKWNPEFAQQYIDEIRLISNTEMKVLFPESIIYKERIGGMTKSFIAHNFK